MKDYKLSEIKKICKEHYDESILENYCECPLWEYPDSCSVIRMFVQNGIPKNWWHIDGEESEE